MTQHQETVTKQKNPLRTEQGKKLVEYNKCKKEELKRLNEQITKRDDIAEHKPKAPAKRTKHFTKLRWTNVLRCCMLFSHVESGWWPNGLNISTKLH